MSTGRKQAGGMTVTTHNDEGPLWYMTKMPETSQLLHKHTRTLTHKNAHVGLTQNFFLRIGY